MSEKQKSKICFFDILPIELVEMIFTTVPVKDLLRNCSLVNRRWNDIIQNPDFIPWKKAYFRYKSLPNDDGSDVSGSWKHHKLFRDFDSKSFAFTNDWIKFETLIGSCLPGNNTLLTILFNNAALTFWVFFDMQHILFHF